MLAHWLFGGILAFGTALQGQPISSPELFDHQPSQSSPSCLAPDPPQQPETSAGRKSNTLSWQTKGPTPSGGFRIYLQTEGKLRFWAATGPKDASYTDSRLIARVTYCYVIAAWTDCDKNGSFKDGVDLETRGNLVVCSVPR